MNKDSIYKLIGYDGEYNKEVKSKLRGLLKKYHPDHNQGKSEIFKLINEVKKELEGNQSKTKNKKETSKKDTDSNNEDFLYYEMKIQELSKQKEELEQKIKQKNKVIKDPLLDVKRGRLLNPSPNRMAKKIIAGSAFSKISIYITFLGVSKFLYLLLLNLSILKMSFMICLSDYACDVNFLD